jgi:hypothetical protein
MDPKWTITSRPTRPRNKSRLGALSGMSNRKPCSGPMTTQPVENRETVPVQTQPMMPMPGRPRIALAKKRSIAHQPLCAETAQLSRQNSLRKQRKAQRASALRK